MKDMGRITLFAFILWCLFLDNAYACPDCTIKYRLPGLFVPKFVFAVLFTWRWLYFRRFVLAFSLLTIISFIISQRLLLQNVLAYNIIFLMSTLDCLVIWGCSRNAYFRREKFKDKRIPVWLIFIYWFVITAVSLWLLS